VLTWVHYAHQQSVLSAQEVQRQKQYHIINLERVGIDIGVTILSRTL